MIIPSLAQTSLLSAYKSSGHLNFNHFIEAIESVPGYRAFTNSADAFEAAVGKNWEFAYSSSPEGRALLAAGDHRLGNLISVEALNQVITAGEYQGHSVALQLIGTPDADATAAAAEETEGRRLLARNSLFSQQHAASNKRENRSDDEAQDESDTDASHPHKRECSRK
jgi:hypothetical protein